MIKFPQVTLRQTHRDDKIRKVNVYSCSFVMVFDVN